VANAADNEAPAEGEPESEAPEPRPDDVFLRREEQEWKEHVRSLLRDEKIEELRAFLHELYASDIAHLIESLEFEEGQAVFAYLPVEEQGAVLYELDEELRERYLKEVLEPESLARILVEQPSDQAADLLEELKLHEVSEVLSQLPHEDRTRVTELLSYPENTAGAIMAKEFVSVQETETVKKAIATLRRQSKDADDIYVVYVVDSEGRYKGHVSLKKLILARPQTRVKRIMEEELLAIPVLTDQEEVANFFTRYDFIAAPVVDDRGVMVGRITVDDVLEVMQEEASEDILRMGGVSGEETLSTPLLRSSLMRASWLVLNLGTAFLSAGVVSLFEGTIQQVVSLAVFLPIVAGMGGNAASQTMALVIRNIALGELTPGKTRKTLRRESLIGLINGVVIGLVCSVFVYLYVRDAELTAIIFTSLLFNLVVAASAGTLVPIFLRRIKVDPAVASSIFVTTFTDTIGFFVLLGLAYLGLQAGVIGP